MRLRIAEFPQEALQLRGSRISPLLDVRRHDGVLRVQVLQCRKACALVRTQVGLVDLHQETVQSIDDHPPRLNAVDLLPRGSDQLVLLLLGGAQVGFQLLGLVLERLVSLKTRLTRLRALKCLPPVLYAPPDRLDPLRGELGLDGEVEDDLARTEVGVLGRHPADDVASLDAIR